MLSEDWYKDCLYIMKKKKKKIDVYFTGSLPIKGETPYGGGEIGNMRTIRMLESFGYKVVPVRRLRSASSDTTFKRIFSFPFRVLINAIHWFYVLLFGSSKKSIAHISGFYGNTILIETIQTFIAKLFRYKLVYELRGGGATKYYEEGSKLYRRQFKYIINSADYLFSQGSENEPLLKSLCKTPIFYYPNCVNSKFYPDYLPVKSTDKVKLLFFGRIEKEKNPLLIVEVAAMLQKKYDNITLSMIGNGQKEMLDQVLLAMKDNLKLGTYELIAGCEHEKLKSLILDKHFYIFPSVQPREGQSNAITEAMSLGIIPIASPQGFNRSTIGDDKLIVEDLTAHAYAERISAIIKGGELNRYSQYVRRRFLDNFTERVVFERTKNEYNLIMMNIRNSYKV